MTEIQGKTVCGGTVSGEAFVFTRKRSGEAENSRPVCKNDEASRLELAVSEVKKKLDECIGRSDDPSVKEILEIHSMMLEDEDILTCLHDAVQNGASAVQAVNQTEEYFSGLFKGTGDEYLIARIDDVRDVCGRLTSFLSDKSFSSKPEKPVILVAGELFPGDLIEIGKENVKGILLGSGTVFSHTSIIIKEMGIPAIIYENIGDVKTGMSVLLNAENGKAYFATDGKVIANLMKSGRFNAEKKDESPFNAFTGKIYVNVGNPLEATPSLFEKCDGIGLFRTEYMYVGRHTLPDEEEQFAVYRNLLEKAGEKAVTVRTFDVGSDKSAEAFHLEKEENPALGFRGLRVYSLFPDVFITQLKALLRAAVYGNLKIMYPMVTSVREISEIKQMLSQAADELKRSGIPYKIPPQGAMIETPAAALLSDSLAEEVDFFSVGTNDLTQYTLALDRQNGRLDRFDDPECKAVLSLIEIAVQNAHKSGIEAGICGELASVPDFVRKWAEIGIDYLSVSPNMI